jgi:hypothetical protein
VRGQSNCPPIIGGAKQRCHLASIFLGRHDQLNLKFSRSGAHLLDILPRVGMVIDIGYFSHNFDPNSFNEGAK